MGSEKNAKMAPMAGTLVSAAISTQVYAPTMLSVVSQRPTRSRPVPPPTRPSAALRSRASSTTAVASKPSAQPSRNTSSVGRCRCAKAVASVSPGPSAKKMGSSPAGSRLIA